MPHCECAGHEATFTSKLAERELRRYLRAGPDRHVRRLVAAISAEGVADASILDIGGGIGVIPFELLGAGAARVVSVDASSAYVDVARREAERRGLADRMAFRQGDFVALASEVEPADVVTLARVICCYPDLPALLGAAVGHARRMVGIVYPRDAWWTRAGTALLNPFSARTRDGFRFFVHREAAIEEVLRSGGFERRSLARGIFWRIAVYERVGGEAG